MSPDIPRCVAISSKPWASRGREKCGSPCCRPPAVKGVGREKGGGRAGGVQRVGGGGGGGRRPPRSMPTPLPRWRADGSTSSTQAALDLLPGGGHDGAAHPLGHPGVELARRRRDRSLVGRQRVASEPQLPPPPALRLARAPAIHVESKHAHRRALRQRLGVVTRDFRLAKAVTCGWLELRLARVTYLLAPPHLD